MNAERAWVDRVKADIASSLAGPGIVVETRWRIPYAVYVTGYPGMRGNTTLAKPAIKTHEYQTDLLIAEKDSASGELVPRVVVEFKLGKVTTHDALTYTTKAGTHKSVHPFLRYGIIIGSYAGPIPQRLIRHGHHFDFMMTLASEELTDSGRQRLINLLKEEAEASRNLGRVMFEKSDIWLLHRNLVIRSD